MINKQQVRKLLTRKNGEKLVIALLRKVSIKITIISGDHPGASNKAYATFRQLHKPITGLFNGNEYTLREQSSKIDNRLIHNSTMSLGKIAGITYFVIFRKQTDGDSIVQYADIHIPKKDQYKLNDFITKLTGPENLEPMIYSIKGATRLSKLIKSGRIEPYHRMRKQYIDDVIYDEIDAIFNRFKNHPEHYIDSTRKETMLVYGPPGTGKTSTLNHMCSKYKLPIISTDAESFPTAVQLAINGKKTPCVILIEELEADYELCAESKESRNGVRLRQAYYREFLNSLDGVIPLKDIMVFLTSNNPEQLKPAVYRKGRVDHHIELPNPKLETVLDRIADPTMTDKATYLMEKLGDIPIRVGFIESLKKANTVDELDKVIKEIQEYEPMLQKFTLDHQSLAGSGE